MPEQKLPDTKTTCWTPVVVMKWVLAIFIFGSMIAAVWLAQHPYEIYSKQPLPALELKTLQGDSFTLHAWNGPMAVNLFASWCAPCDAEMPQIKQLAAVIPVYGIAWRDQPAPLKQWLERHGHPFQGVGLDTGAELMFRLRVNGVPTTLLLDEQRRIVHVHQGGIRPGDMPELLAKVRALRKPEPENARP